jgi:AraC-like DNA-binding protein
MVARAHGLSSRQAQRFFAHSDTTFTEFVLAERLSLAHRLLNEPRFRHRKISDIAYSTGFGDLSYFNREFRRRFGDSPSAIRKGLPIGWAAKNPLGQLTRVITSSMPRAWRPKKIT